MERAIVLGRERLNHETNIVELIQACRFFKVAFSILLTKQQRERLKNFSQFETIDPDKSQQTPSED